MFSLSLISIGNLLYSLGSWGTILVLTVVVYLPPYYQGYRLVLALAGLLELSCTETYLIYTL